MNVGLEQAQHQPEVESAVHEAEQGTGYRRILHELRGELRAPYHDSFLEWMERGGTVFRSAWRD